MPEQGKRTLETARDGSKARRCGQARRDPSAAHSPTLSHSATLTLGRTLMPEKSGAVNEDASGAFKLLKSDGISGSCGGQQALSDRASEAQEGKRGLWLASSSG